jgi:UDP-N-acetylglucosamine--N-acetylmuramyl-(pentapeptide) pyrophosphoryl-undecaprenol N-acetylglucosamine transferase
MKVAITGGGTAGHITPLLAIADELKATHPDFEILYIGQHNDPMRQIVDDNLSIQKSYSILAGKFRRYHGVGIVSHLLDISTNLKNARDLIYFLFGFLQSLVILIINRPNLLFVKGGYVGLPVGLAAAFLKIPIVTHDSDCMPGLTNRLLSKYALLHAVGMPINYYNNTYQLKKLRYTGVPVRNDFLVYYPKSEARKKFGLSLNDKVLAIVGGSLGAARLNHFVYKNIEIFNNNNIKLLWVTGTNTHKQYSDLVDKKSMSIFSFTNDLPSILNSADLVISRAGATAIAELAILEQPTILVPNPILAGGHQTQNAKKIEQEKAAVVLSEDMLNKNPLKLSEIAINILNNKNKQDVLVRNIKKLAVSDSSLRIVKVIEEALNV